jgi:hypothetical protein
MRQELLPGNLSTIFIRAFPTHARQQGTSSCFERKLNSHFAPLGVDNLTRKLLNSQRSSLEKVVHGARSTNHCWTRDDVVVRATIVDLHHICQPTSLSKLTVRVTHVRRVPGIGCLECARDQCRRRWLLSTAVYHVDLRTANVELRFLLGSRFDNE